MDAIVVYEGYNFSTSGVFRAAVLPRIPISEDGHGLAAKQDADDDSGIDFRDIPELTDKQLASAKRPARRPVAARLDQDVIEWLQSFSPGYSSRINSILRSVMEHQQR